MEQKRDWNRSLRFVLVCFVALTSQLGRAQSDLLFRQMAAGNAQAFGIQIDGTLWDWGLNNFGQLGDGTTANRPTPAQIDSTTNWLSVASGCAHGAAVKRDGTLWTWGLNNFGQLGDGTAQSKSSAVQVGSATNWVSVAAGYYHTLALKRDGTLWAWGYNVSGQLGDGTFDDKHSPVQLGDASNWLSVAAGDYHSVAMKTDGSLWAWGQNYDGQVGDGTTQNKSSPVQLGAATNWLSIAAGCYHTAALKRDGTLWAWGNNPYGQLGDGTTDNKTSPVQIGTATNWVSVAPGRMHTVALKRDGSLWGWGYNYYGQLGDGTSADKTIPTQIGSATDWQFAAAGYYFTLATKTNGALWTWGYNNYGQLGNGETVNRSTPGKVGIPVILVQPTDAGTRAHAEAAFQVTATGSSPLSYQWRKNGTGLLEGGALSGATSTNLTVNDVNLGDQGGYSVVVSNSFGSVTSRVATLALTELMFRQVEAGSYHTLGIKTDGTLWGWGYNSYGQLGNGTQVSTNGPTRIGTATDWHSLAAGSSHSLALKNNGTLWTWGNNGYGQLGNATQTSTNSPVQVGSGMDWKSAAAGNSHSLALKSNGTLWAWGYNSSGQLGDGTTTNRSAPTQVGMDMDWSQVAGGSSHTAAIKTDGTLWTWGNNSSGQLGNGTQTTTNTPVQAGSDRTWQSVAAGSQHTVAIKTDGTLWAWGNNSYGQLGDGTTVNESNPAQIGPAADWQSVAAGAYHTVAIKTDGTLWAWGNNSSGQLGDGTTVNKSRPAQIGSDTDWQSVAAGDSFTVAMKTDGTLWNWGQNNDGQLGNGTQTASPIPLKMGAPTILIQPIYTTNAAGTALFTFTPSGTAPLSYQWFKNGTALVNGATISGATNLNLAIANLPVNESDSFTVVVSNTYGCIVSSPASFSSDLNSFSPSAGTSSSTVYAAARQSDGKIVVGGTFATLAGAARSYVGRVNADGTLDSMNISPVSYVSALTVQPDDKILLGGYWKTINGLTIKRIARLNADGSLETAFNPTINTPGSDVSSVRTMLVLSNGQILVGGDFTAISGVTRINFGRVNANGSLDSSYAMDANGIVLCMAAQADGKIVLGGSFTSLGGQARNHIARLNADGSLDYPFDPGADGAVNALAVQTDGKILVGGSFSTLAGRSRSNLGRLYADGTADDSFNPGANGPVNSIVIQTDGRIIAGGTFATLGGQSLHSLGLLNPDGAVDARFQPWFAGSSVIVNTLVLQPDNNVVVGGRFDTVDGVGRTNLCRLSIPDALLLIIKQPTNATCPVGATISFNGVVEGTAPLQYQWFKGGAALADDAHIGGSTSPMLTLTNVSMADAGGYSLVVANSSGTSTSSVAVLKVLMPFAPTNVTANPLPFGTVGRTYSQTMAAAGGVAPYTWAISGGALPPGLLLTREGVLSGTPTLSTNAAFTVRVADSNGAYAEDDFSLVVFTAPVIATPSLLPAGKTGEAYSQILSGSGGTMPYSWDVVAGALPQGLTLSSNGVLSGTPTVAASSSFAVRMTTANGVSSTNTFSLTIMLQTTLLAEDFEHGGAMPSGWTQEAVSGSASWGFQKGGNGSPQNAHGGVYNALLYGSSGNVTRLVTPPIDFGTNTKARLTFWLDMKTYLLYQDALAVYYRTSSAAPWTLLQNYSYCSSWTQQTLDLPALSGTYSIAFEGRTYGGYGVCIDDVAVTATTEPVPPTLVNGDLPSGTVGVPYEFALAAVAGRPPYAWGVAGGDLAPGLALSSAGVFSGTPTQVGLFSFAVKVTGTDGYSSTNPCSIAINPVSTMSNPTYLFTTFVGGNSGSSDGTNGSAQFEGPTGLGLDSSNNLYVADTDNHTIRKVTPQGGVTTLAGLAGNSGTNDGGGSGARFYNPRGLAVDTNNLIYVADQNNNTIRIMTPGGATYTLAGRAGWSGYDPTNGTYYFNQPGGVAVGNGNCYVADTEASTIAELRAPDAALHLIAGWNDGFADGTNASARFLWPEGIAFSQESLFVADTGNAAIRRVTMEGVVTTLAGSPGATGSADGTNFTAQFHTPGAIAADAAGNLFVVDRGNHNIRRITPQGVVTTIGGWAGSPGQKDGVGIAARFDAPDGIAVDQDGVLYIADTANNRIVKGTPLWPPVLSLKIQGTRLNLSWPATCLGWELQAQTNALGPNWFTVGGSTTTNQFSLQTDGARAVFYRLHKPD